MLSESYEILLAEVFEKIKELQYYQKFKILPTIKLFAVGLYNA